MKAESNPIDSFFHFIMDGVDYFAEFQELVEGKPLKSSGWSWRQI